LCHCNCFHHVFRLIIFIISELKRQHLVNLEDDAPSTDANEHQNQPAGNIDSADDDDGADVSNISFSSNGKIF